MVKVSPSFVFAFNRVVKKRHSDQPVVTLGRGGRKPRRLKGLGIRGYFRFTRTGRKKTGFVPPSKELYFIKSGGVRGGFKYSPSIFAVQPVRAAARFRRGRYRLYNKIGRFFQFPFLDSTGSSTVQSNFIFFRPNREPVYPSIPLSALVQQFFVLMGVRETFLNKTIGGAGGVEKQPVALDFASLPIWNRFKSGYFIRLLGLRFFLPNSRTGFYRPFRKPGFKKGLSYLLPRGPVGYLRLVLILLAAFMRAPTSLVAGSRRVLPLVARLLKPVSRFVMRRVLPVLRPRWFRALARLRLLFRPSFTLWASGFLRFPVRLPILIGRFDLPISKNKIIIRKPIKPVGFSKRSLVPAYFAPLCTLPLSFVARRLWRIRLVGYARVVLAALARRKARRRLRFFYRFNPRFRFNRFKFNPRFKRTTRWKPRFGSSNSTRVKKVKKRRVVAPSALKLLKLKRRRSLLRSSARQRPTRSSSFRRRHKNASAR